jgi:superfamily II DNA or RNA helicase
MQQINAIAIITNFVNNKVKCPLRIPATGINNGIYDTPNIEQSKENYLTFCNKFESPKVFIPWESLPFRYINHTKVTKSNDTLVFFNCFIKTLLFLTRKIKEKQIPNIQGILHINLNTIVQDIGQMKNNSKSTRMNNNMIRFCTILEQIESMQKSKEQDEKKEEEKRKTERDLESLRLINKNLEYDKKQQIKCAKIFKTKTRNCDIKMCVAYSDNIQKVLAIVENNEKIFKKNEYIHVKDAVKNITQLDNCNDMKTSLQILEDLSKKVENIHRIETLRTKNKPYWLDCTGYVQMDEPCNNEFFNEKEQCDDGFRNYVMKNVVKNVNDETDTNACDNTDLKPHQQMVKELLSKSSPVRRLLVHHRVGSGKTRTAIEILNSYYDDPRTKIVICPSEPLCQQFLKVLFEDTKNKYKDWANTFSSEDPYKGYNLGTKHKEGYPPAKRTSFENELNHVIYFEKSKENLFSQFLPGPLIVLPIYKVEYILEQTNIKTYQKDTKELEMTPHFRHGMLHNNPMSGKIVIFDEFHTLFEPTTHVRTMFNGDTTIKQIDFKMLKDSIQTMKGSVLAAFSATPPDFNNTNDLCRVLTGYDTKTTTLKDLDGYVHYYNGNGGVFPQVDPIDNLQNVVNITSEQLDTQICEVPDSRIKLHKYTEAYRNITCPLYKLYDDHIRNKILDNLERYAPKISKMMIDLEKYKTKGENILILCSEKTGLNVVVNLFQQKKYQYIRISPNFSNIYSEEKVQKMKSYTHAIRRWNLECSKSMDKNPIQIIIIDTEKLAEGLNVIGVSVILGLSSYKNAESMEQAFGRADRMCTSKQYRNPTNNFLKRIHYITNIDTNNKPYDDWKKVQNLKNKYKTISF